MPIKCRGFKKWNNPPDGKNPGQYSSRNKAMREARRAKPVTERSEVPASKGFHPGLCAHDFERAPTRIHHRRAMIQVLIVSPAIWFPFALSTVRAAKPSIDAYTRSSDKARFFESIELWTRNSPLYVDISPYN
jgi:hypothetical protein